MILFFAFLGLVIQELAYAQDFGFLMDRGTNTYVETDYHYSPLPSSGNLKSAVSQGMINVSHSHKFDPATWTVGAKVQELDFSRHDEYLRDYESYQGTLGYRRPTEDGNFWSLMGTYGSASDRPFKNADDGTVSVNGIKKFSPHWFGVINYSNNRAFLNNIPLPGFFWVKEMTKEKALIIGFPFVFWMTPVGENFSLRYLGLLPWSHRLRLSYRRYSYRPHINFEQAPQSYFRHDREEKRHRVFWFERRLGLGVEKRFGPLVADVQGGLAFDRQLYEARNFSESKQRLNKLSNSSFVSLNLKLSI